jgi:hypothetical protein
MPIGDIGPRQRNPIDGHRLEKTYLCFDLPVVSGQASQPRLAAIQANPFIHDVNQRYARADARRNWSKVTGRMPDKHWRIFGSGGARRDRTDDLKLAKLPLSQLSYGPG